MKAFVSSVIRGLEHERDAAAEGIRSLGHTPRRSEDFAASPEPPQVVCRAGVRDSEVVILILGARYGDVQPSGKSAVHEEYEEAQQLHIPVLAFAEIGTTPETEQEAFMAEVRNWVGGEFNGRFATPGELQGAVVRALHEFEVNRAVGPSDPAEIRVRADSAIPVSRTFGAGGAQLVVAVAGGPRQAVLRPQVIEGADLASWLQREAMFGAPGILDPAAATQTERAGGRLRLVQAHAEVSVDEQGTVVVVQPGDGFSSAVGLPAIIHEDVVGRLGASLAFAGSVLDHIDQMRRISDLVCLAALIGGGYTAWRSRAEHEASPNTMSMNMHGAERIVVETRPLRISRPALLAQHRQRADDMAVLLRRAATERQ